MQGTGLGLSSMEAVRAAPCIASSSWASRHALCEKMLKPIAPAPCQGNGRAGMSVAGRPRLQNHAGALVTMSQCVPKCMQLQKQMQL